jgi:hypothetical protein
LCFKYSNFRISNQQPYSRLYIFLPLDLSRPASVSNLQPKRVPFANYGWATKSKDLSVKPTHNALANKNLARQRDSNAVLELTLHKLKKEASRIANEYSTIESKVAEQFHTGRSESRAWNSEYDSNFPDYSKYIALQSDLYHRENPYKLSKSQLVLNYPPLRRGPRSASKKVYYI